MKQGMTIEDLNKARDYFKHLGDDVGMELVEEAVSLMEHNIKLLQEIKDTKLQDTNKED